MLAENLDSSQIGLKIDKYSKIRFRHFREKRRRTVIILKKNEAKQHKKLYIPEKVVASNNNTVALQV